MDDLIKYIKTAFQWLKKVFRKVVNGVLNFFKEIVGWFKSLRLNPQLHTPFFASSNTIKEMLKTAPVKNVGIFEGVYNQSTDEIEYNQFIEADELDAQTRRILGNEELVVLS